MLYYESLALIIQQSRHLAHLNATKQLYQDGMKKLLHYCAFPKVNNNNNDKKKKTFWKIRENSDN